MPFERHFQSVSNSGQDLCASLRYPVRRLMRKQALCPWLSIVKWNPMHHRIHAAYHQAKCSRSSCAWLFIDNTPIEEWLNNHLDYPDLDLNGLSLMWLLDEEEDALAQRRFAPAQDGTTTPAPLLVCGDDMNFDCFVLMTEQVIDGTTLHWRRFGHSVSGGLEVGINTQWGSENRSVSFSLADFHEALAEFYRLMKA